MNQRKIALFVAILAVVGVFALGRATLAKHGVDDTTGDDNSLTVAPADDSPEHEEENEQEVEHLGDDNRPHHSNDDYRKQVELRRDRFEQKLATKRADRRETLSAKRLEVCEKRQTRINHIFTQATERNKRHLAVFSKIEDRVEQFYQRKGLSAEGYTAAVANANDKQAAALAAIEASEHVSFDCEHTDGTRPGGVIKEAMKNRHTALKAYRTAVKDLILVVKHSLSNQLSDTASGTTKPVEEQ